MDSSLKERFAQLGPIQGIEGVLSGSPADLVLRLPQSLEVPRTIDATHALARRGMTMLQAKRSIEALIERGSVFVTLPIVEDVAKLVSELTKARVAASVVQPVQMPDVRRLRERLQLTRDQFALRYGLDTETVRNWEVGRRKPDMAACSYLRAISNDPERVERAYAPTPPL